MVPVNLYVRKLKVFLQEKINSYKKNAQNPVTFSPGMKAVEQDLSCYEMI